MTLLSRWVMLLSLRISVNKLFTLLLLILTEQSGSLWIQLKPGRNLLDKEWLIWIVWFRPARIMAWTLESIQALISRRVFLRIDWQAQQLFRDFLYFVWVMARIIISMILTRLLLGSGRHQLWRNIMSRAIGPRALWPMMLRFFMNNLKKEKKTRFIFIKYFIILRNCRAEEILSLRLDSFYKQNWRKQREKNKLKKEKDWFCFF